MDTAAGPKIRHVPDVENITVLADDQASRWQGFADMGWEQWRECEKNSTLVNGGGLEAQTFDWMDVVARAHWSGVLSRESEKLEGSAD